MAFYSTFTYLGIGVISGVYGFLTPAALPVLLTIYLLPSFLFLYLLYKEQNKTINKELIN